jgi:broad specificity phosphatase PhoE
MTTIYIARHGQTENNLNRRFSGWIDTPLTSNGVEDAKSSGTKLSGKKIDQIISSDLGRAFATAYIISRVIGFEKDIKTDKGLREMNYGDFANVPYSKYPNMTPLENAFYVSPNGESLAQSQQRVINSVKSIASDNPDKTILLVAHDGTINAIRADFTGNNIGLVDAKRLNKHDTVVRFVFENNKIKSLEEIS